MNYKFIDIGCATYCVSSDDHGLDAAGIYVEPIKEFLDILPGSDSIKRECSAIGDYNGEVEFTTNIITKKIKYFSKSEIDYIVKSNKLDRVEKVYELGPHSSIKTNDYHKKENFKKVKVPCITLKSLLDKYNVKEVEYIKIDTEGYEEQILQQLLECMRDKSIIVSKQIRFEYNHLSNLKSLDLISDTIALEFGFEKVFIEDWWDKDIYMNKVN